MIGMFNKTNTQKNDIQIELAHERVREDSIK